MARTTGGDREKDTRSRKEVSQGKSLSRKKAEERREIQKFGEGRKKASKPKEEPKREPKPKAQRHSAAKTQAQMANKLLDALIEIAAERGGSRDFGPGSVGLTGEVYDVPRYGRHRVANLNVGPLSAEIATRRGGLPGGFGEGELPGQRTTGSVDWDSDLMWELLGLGGGL